MDTNPPMRLAAETQFYEAHKTEWLQTQRDKFVVVKGTFLLDFFSEFHDAYAAGVERFGDQEFLVKRVVANEPVFLVL